MTTQISKKSSENSKLNDTSVSEAVTQFKEAASSIYDAINSIGNATTSNAKTRLHEGKVRALELEERAEEMVKAKPLVTLGIAFAAGWVVSYLLRSHR